MTELDLLLTIVDQAYNRRSWHGTNLRGSIRGVSAVRAAWRPSPKRHNIWEEVVHAAYWKYAVWRRLSRQRRGTFAIKGSNWFRRPENNRASEAAWRADVGMLDDVHRSLRETIAELSPASLSRPLPGSGPTTPLFLVTGIAAHDLYHAGQIQLLKKLSAAGRARR